MEGRSDDDADAVRRAPGDRAIGYDETNLYARIHVVDDTPLVNGGDDPNVVFKSGDVVGLDLGPAGDRDKPMLGDVRILAAKMQGACRLMAMKPLSRQAKRPQRYYTPGVGHESVRLRGRHSRRQGGADGRCRWQGLHRVADRAAQLPGVSHGPRSRDQGRRGGVALGNEDRRACRPFRGTGCTPGGHSQTTMTDDIPTEAWLYPQFWGTVSVK